MTSPEHQERESEAGGDPAGASVPAPPALPPHVLAALAAFGAAPAAASASTAAGDRAPAPGDTGAAASGSPLARSDAGPVAAALRAGASAAAPGEGDLPLVVWLRGDEPYCAAFTLEADDVMRQLGIRRSRLTQISGKELRVGRIRRGRYVSPVFRQADVDHYLGWTRATASHQKSSAVIDEAADSLRTAGEAMAARLQDVPETVVAGVTATVGALLEATSAATQRAVHEQAARLAQLPVDLTALAAAGALESPRFREAFAAISDMLATLLQRSATHALVAERTLGDLAETSGLVRVTREDLAALAAQTAASVAEAHDRLAVLATRLADLEAALTPPAPRPRPRRGEADARRLRRLVARDAQAAAPRARTVPRKARRPRGR